MRPELYTALTPKQADDLVSAWDFVGQAHEHGSDHCKTCPYRDSHREFVGLYPNAAEQPTTLCMLGKNKELPDLCPALIADRFSAMDETYGHH